MATKLYCDGCGAECQGHVTITVTTTRPLVMPKPNKVNRDLCQACFGRLMDGLKNVIEDVVPAERKSE